MTQRQITHTEALPPCHAGHTARHIRDNRCARAGGGHQIECQCRATTRHETFDQAMDQWCHDNHRAVPVQRRLPLRNVFHFGGRRQ